MLLILLMVLVLISWLNFFDKPWLILRISQALFWRFLSKKFLTFILLLLRTRWFNYAFLLWDIAELAGTMAYVTYSIVERNTVVLIHAYSYKRVWRSILFNVRTTFLVSLERVDALCVNFLHLVISNVFHWIDRSRPMVRSLLSVGLVTHLLYEVVTQLYLLGLRDPVLLIVLLAWDVNIVLNVRQLRLVVAVLGTCLSVLYRHVRLEIPVIQCLDVPLFLIVGHVDLAIECGLAQYFPASRAIVSTISCIFKSRDRHQFTILYGRGDIGLLFCYLWQGLITVHQQSICAWVVSHALEGLQCLLGSTLILEIDLLGQSVLEILIVFCISEVLGTLRTYYRISVLLLQDFLLRSQDLGVLLDDQVFFLVGRCRDEFVYRELETLFKLLVSRCSF